MVDIAPFKSLRYNEKKFPSLSALICPPYDVISVTEYDKLMRRHPQNIVRVELPLAQGQQDRYAVAAQFWAKWQAQRILQEDKEPAFYGYEQRFSIGSKAFFRRGFFAALRIERPGRGRVRPHERTFPKHREDRMKLMRATHANISPIFGIFFDRHQKARRLLAARMSAKPLVVSRDDKGVTHRLWRWTDRDAIRTLAAVLRAEDVLIADGHHRYETSWEYAQERSAKDRKGGRRRSYRFVMTFLCPLGDPGLVIHPTHRAVRGALPWEEWKKRIETSFSIQRLPSLTALLTRLRGGGKSGGLGLVMEGGKVLWLSPKGSGPALPVVALHERVLKDIPLDRISYGQDPKELVETLMRGEAPAVFLLPSPDKEAFARISRAGRLLPQKSTYFYPKVATGLVMRSLDGDL